MNHKAPAIPLYDKDIPCIIDEFLELLGGKDVVRRRLLKNHRIFPVVQYYFKYKDDDWSKIEIPDNILLEINAIGHFVIVLKNIIKDAGCGKPLMRFYKVDYYDTLCAEAQVASEYLRRGYLIRWPSIFCQDPPGN